MTHNEKKKKKKEGKCKEMGKMYSFLLWLILKNCQWFKSHSTDELDRMWQ
jgi:hypothetical protein